MDRNCEEGNVSFADGQELWGRDFKFRRWTGTVKNRMLVRRWAGTVKNGMLVSQIDRNCEEGTVSFADGQELWGRDCKFHRWTGTVGKGM